LALTEKVKKDNAKTGRSIYQIGETYGSPELIASYLGPQLLDAQFDFNLYDAAVAAFKSDKGNFTPLAETLLESKRWYGSHHSMGNITGNQDRPRFISLADGSIAENDNTKQVGWDKNIQVTSDEAYKKLQNLAAFMNFIPGVPVIYYGDEIGMPGANDPDSRRDMRFENQLKGKSELTSQETQNKKIISGLIKMRTSSMALTFGDCVVEESSNNSLIIKRKYFDEEWFFLSLNGSEAEINQKLARFGLSIFLMEEQGTGSQNLFTSQDLQVKKLKNNTNSIEYINMLKSGNCTVIIKAK
jgi:glycosidase